MAIADFIPGFVRKPYTTLACTQCRQMRHRTVRELNEWRMEAKRSLAYHDSNICQAINRSMQHSTAPNEFTENDKGHHHPQELSPEEIHIRMIADVHTRPLLASRLASTISSCPPPIAAELRRWQKAARIIAYIDSATSYISTSVDSDPQTEKICDTMFTTVASFFPPHSPPFLLQPAELQPDDRERVMDRQVFYDEPPMQALIASLDEPSRMFLQEAAEREKERLPLFPAHFEMFWEGQTGPSKEDFWLWDLDVGINGKELRHRACEAV